MKNVTAILSMLHEPSEVNSATRAFRGTPVLSWVLQRLARSDKLAAAGVLCWEDQLPGVAPVAGDGGAYVLAKGPRIPVPELEAITAARRWSDGWRGGLLGTCDFDLGFHAPWVKELAQKLESDAIVLIDPAAALVDASLLDDLLTHAEAHPSAEFCFLPAAPGLCGPLLRPALLDRLAASRAHCGKVLHYAPDQISRELLGGESNAPAPTPVVRSLHRLTLSSDRQIARVTGAMISLNGQLLSSDAEELVRRMDAYASADPMPREVVLELGTARLSRPIFLPSPIERTSLQPKQALALFAELAELDDTRLTIAGLGDPMLVEAFFEILDAAKLEGRLAIHVETDFLTTPEAVARLAASPVDVVSLHIPALTDRTYEQVMGIGAYSRVLENVKVFVSERRARNRQVPILVPTFIKCRENLTEMEEWYDQWLRALGSAVIKGPSDFAGQIEDKAVADMSPPKRRPCFRLVSRLAVLSDGRIVTCEEDFLGRQALGVIGTDSIRDVWQKRVTGLRKDHQDSQWARHPLCASCREWHRP